MGVSGAEWVPHWDKEKLSRAKTAGLEIEVVGERCRIRRGNVIAWIRYNATRTEVDEALDKAIRGENPSETPPPQRYGEAE